MDVVLTSFKKYGGKVQIESEKGKATKFIGVIPQVISSMPCAILKVGKERFIVLKKNIREFSSFEKQNLDTIENKKVYRLRNQIYPLINLREILFPDDKEDSSPSHIILMEIEEKIFAFLFDDILAFEDMIIKPMPPEIKGINLFSGISFASDGRIYLLLDPIKLTENYKLENIGDFIKQEKKVKEESISFLIFESCGRKYLVNTQEILHVEKISRMQETLVLDKPMIRVNYQLHTLINLEKCLKVSETERNSEVFALIFKHAEESFAILVDQILDVLDDLLLFENKKMNSRSVPHYTIMEEEIVLHLKPQYLLPDSDLNYAP
jgi:two-component system, chemotaxis family, sensor kinase CheA